MRHYSAVRQKNSEQEIREGLPTLYPRLWRYALTLSGRRDLAGDLAQAACLRALENAGAYTPGTYLDRWMFTLLHRIWLNEVRSAAMRQAKSMVPVHDIDVANNAPGAEANIFAGEVLSQVYALPEAQRVTVLLVYVEGYRYKEAAEILDIPIGTVMSRLAAA